MAAKGDITFKVDNVVLMLRTKSIAYNARCMKDGATLNRRRFQKMFSKSFRERLFIGIA